MLYLTNSKDNSKSFKYLFICYLLSRCQGISVFLLIPCYAIHITFTNRHKGFCDWCFNLIILAMLKIHFCMSYLGTVSKISHYLLSWIASEDIPIRIRYSVIRIDARKAGISSIIQITEPQKQTSFFDILFTEKIISHFKSFWKAFSLCWGGESPLGYSANSPPTPFIERRARIFQSAYEIEC